MFTHRHFPFARAARRAAVAAVAVAALAACSGAGETTDSQNVPTQAPPLTPQSSPTASIPASAASRARVDVVTWQVFEIGPRKLAVYGIGEQGDVRGQLEVRDDRAAETDPTLLRVVSVYPAPGERVVDAEGRADDARVSPLAAAWMDSLDADLRGENSANAVAPQGFWDWVTSSSESRPPQPRADCIVQSVSCRVYRETCQWYCSTGYIGATWRCGRCLGWYGDQEPRP